MPRGWGPLRSVVEEHIAQISIDALTGQFERFEDAWEGLKWLLSRTPEDIGRHRTHEGVTYWLCHRKGDKHSGIPSLGVIYTFDDETVVIHAVMGWQADHEA